MSEIERWDQALLEEHLVSEDVREIPLARLAQLARSRTHPHGFPGPIVDRAELITGHSFTMVHSIDDETLECWQYSSSEREEDMDSLPPMDAIAVLERISKLEEHLLGQQRAAHPGEASPGWLLVSKHKQPGEFGYQRLLFSPQAPALLAADLDEIATRGSSWPARLETSNPAELTLGEFRGGLTAVIPASPRCAFEIVIYFRPAATGRLSDLSGDQRWGLAQAIREITGALRLEFAVRGWPEVYDWTLHAAPGLDAHLHITTGVNLDVAGDAPADWAALLKDHLGLE